MRRFPRVVFAGIVFLVSCSHALSTIPQPFRSLQIEKSDVGASSMYFSVLHSFDGADGRGPIASLIIDSAGNLYGTTDEGGSSQDGAVFKVDPTGDEVVLHSFNVLDGIGPQAGLVRDAVGNLYGTTVGGGPPHKRDGVVFKLDPNGNEVVLHSFSGRNGNTPQAQLIRDAAGNIYGTTYIGGGSPNCFAGCGVVFKLDPSGVKTVLHRFDGANGKNPTAGLVQDAAGNLYGTTEYGGTLNMGVVFKLGPSGKETVLHSFSGADGKYPGAGCLVQDADGSLYGTTVRGGPPYASVGQGLGVVFKLNPNGHETVLHSFNGSDGDGPNAGLVRDATGNLYGTTVNGGSSSCFGFGCGVVFKLEPSGKEIVLHSFNGSDGYGPSAGLVRDNVGNLYGTAAQGGSSNDGVVFKLTHKSR